MNRLAVLSSVASTINRHLRARAPREEGCFCLVYEGQGVEGKRFLVSEVILPPPGAWEAQENDQLRLSSSWVSAVISQAINAGAGLLFIHSHPNSNHPPGLSPIDRESSVALAGTIAPMLAGPFLVAVVHPTGWAAAAVEEGALESIERISAVGRTLLPLRKDAPADLGSNNDIDDRQRDALGLAHETLRGLTVGVVGSGGLGSPIAEQLVRMGVAAVILIDDDRLDTPSNIRRVFGSTGADLRHAEPPAKVDVVADHLERLLLDVTIRRVKGDVRYERIFRNLLDADVVLCGTDSHGSRAVLNDLASAYLLPVIDVGVRAGAKTGGRLAALTAEIRILRGRLGSSCGM